MKLRSAILAAASLCALAAVLLGAQILAAAWRVSPAATAWLALALPLAMLAIARDLRRQCTRQEARRQAIRRTLGIAA